MECLNIFKFIFYNTLSSLFYLNNMCKLAAWLFFKVLIKGEVERLVYDKIHLILRDIKENYRVVFYLQRYGSIRWFCTWYAITYSNKAWFHADGILYISY